MRTGTSAYRGLKALYEGGTTRRVAPDFEDGDVVDVDYLDYH